MTPKPREELAAEIKLKAISWCVDIASLEEVESLNVLQATLLSMSRTVDGLLIKPDKIYVDGNVTPKMDVPAEAIVKGDDLVPAISAASILAKVAIKELHKIYPQYSFDKNKGYLTKQHMVALQEHGPCPIHRKTYAPIRKLIEE